MVAAVKGGFFGDPPRLRRGCLILEYKMACQDAARFGLTDRRSERMDRLADEVRALGGFGR